MGTKTKTIKVGKEGTGVQMVTSGVFKGFIIMDLNWSKKDLKNIFSDQKKQLCKMDGGISGYS